MKITKVACQNCGANLKVDESIRFVTCGYCDASLEIVHDPTTTYSKALEDVVKRQDAVEAELKVIRLEKELQRMERNWQSFRNQVCSKRENGELVEPNRVGPIMFGIFAWLIALIVLGVAVDQRSGLLALGAIGCGLIAVFLPKQGLRRAREFGQMRHRYLRNRNRLQGDLASAERARRFAPMKRSG